MQKFILSALVVFAILLSACGGEGGNGSSYAGTIISVSTGETVSHLAENAGSYDWYSFVPDGIDVTKPVTIMIDGGKTAADYSQATLQAKYYLDWVGEQWPLVENNIVAVSIAIPLFRSYEIDVYPHTFSPRTFEAPVDDFYLRADLKILEIIQQANNYLTDGGYVVDEKVIMYGQSAGGMVSQRFTILHPEKVKMVVANQAGGALIMPEDSYGIYQMEWPVGTFDYEQYTGKVFNRELYKSIPQFYLIGQNDTGPDTWMIYSSSWGFNVNDYTLEQSQWLYDTFGSSQPISFENQANYMIDNGYNVRFKLYSGVGHEWDNPDMLADEWAFIEEMNNL